MNMSLGRWASTRFSNVSSMNEKSRLMAIAWGARRVMVSLSVTSSCSVSGSMVSPLASSRPPVSMHSSGMTGGFF